MDTDTLFIILAIVTLMGFSLYTLARSRGALHPAAGRVRVYEAPGKTPVECRRLLGQRTEQDLFAYRLEASAYDGWLITFTRLAATDQLLNAVYHLQFAGGCPARIALKRERSPLNRRGDAIPDELLDRFFAAKCGARLVPPE